MADAPDFRHHTSIEVRFRDLDALRHVNNAVFLSYLEHARLRYLRDVVGIASIRGLAMILASISVDYLSPVHLGETIRVATRVDSIGRTSLSMSHEITVERDGRLAARASSVLVSYDYAAERPQPVSDGWRRALVDFEGRPLDRDADRAAGHAAGTDAPAAAVAALRAGAAVA